MTTNQKGTALKRLLALSLTASLVLGLSTAATAGNPTPPPPPLPPDQLVLTGSCLTVDAVLAAANQAMSLYVPGDQPAGVIINGNWVPAAWLASNAGLYAVTTGCPPTPTPVTTPVTVAPVPSSMTTLAPTTTSTVPVTSSTTVPSPTTTAPTTTTTTVRRCHKRWEP